MEDVNKSIQAGWMVGGKCRDFCATGSYQQGLRVKCTRVLLDQSRRRLKTKAYIYKKNSSSKKYALRNKKFRLCMQIIIKMAHQNDLRYIYCIYI